MWQCFFGLLLHDRNFTCTRTCAPTHVRTPPCARCVSSGWSSHDGLGALVITPTRELAMQIFDVLKIIGEKFDFSAGLVIGGKSYAEEAELIQAMNILVCTPVRAPSCSLSLSFQLLFFLLLS